MDHSLSGPEGEPASWGVFRRGFAANRFRTMELITILNRSHHFHGFVYQRACFGLVGFRRGLSVLAARKS
jgi:hypothetical protein